MVSARSVRQKCELFSSLADACEVASRHPIAASRRCDRCARYDSVACLSPSTKSFFRHNNSPAAPAVLVNRSNSAIAALEAAGDLPGAQRARKVLAEDIAIMRAVTQH